MQPISFSSLRNKLGLNGKISFSTILSSSGGGNHKKISDLSTQVNNYSSGLYVFTTHTFTSAGTTGKNGPTLTACKTAYSNQTWAQNSNYLNMTTNGIQIWTVPTTGTYSIEVHGARGGNASYQSAAVGGSGYAVKGSYNLTQNDKLYIVVGQNGIDDTYNGGGGGGSFVYLNSISQSSILFAGGGGGGGCTASNAAVSFGVPGTSNINGTQGTLNTGIKRGGAGVNGGGGGGGANDTLTAGAGGNGPGSTGSNGSTTVCGKGGGNSVGGAGGSTNFNGGGGGGGYGINSACTFLGGAAGARDGGFGGGGASGLGTIGYGGGGGGGGYSGGGGGGGGGGFGGPGGGGGGGSYIHASATSPTFVGLTTTPQVIITKV